MCGRYIANSEDEIVEIREILKQISMRFLSAEIERNAALSDIFPTDKVMIINSSAEITKAKWGIEKWDKKGVIINAKSETFEQSKFFSPFAKNRCVVPAHGYYEWRTVQDKKKVKYVFMNENNRAIFMAGILKPSFQKGEQGELAIITRPAAEEILFIHPRMPLIIKAEQIGQWLSGAISVRELKKQSPGILWKEAV